MRPIRQVLLPALALTALLAVAHAVRAVGPDDRAATVSDPVYAFEKSLAALPTKEAQIDATRKFFDGLKDRDTKLAAVGVFDARYVYTVPAEAADDVLGKLLNDSDLKVRLRAAHALGYLGKGGNHFDDLVALFKDADVAGLHDVLYAMGRSRDQQFVPFLREALKSDDSGVKLAAAFELARLSARDARGDIVPLLKDPKPEVRACAIENLSLLGDDADTPRIREMLDDPDAFVRSRAATALGFRKGDETAKALAAKLTDPAPSVRAAAAFSLGELKATAYRGAVEKLLDDHDLVARRYAVKSLGEMGDAAARPALEGKLKDEDYMVRSLALESLSALGDKAAAKAVAAALADPQADVRRSAAEALMRLKAVESVPALLKLLDDKDDRVRWMAALAVGRLGDPSVLPELRRQLDKPDADVRDKLSEAISEIETREKERRNP